MSEDLERARRLEEACDFSSASEAALAGGDLAGAARLACLAGDATRLVAARDALAEIGVETLARVAEDLFARGYGAFSGELFERAAEYERAGAAFAAGGEPCRAALAFERADKPADGARALERAIKADASRDDCRLALGALLLRHGRLEAATKALQGVSAEGRVQALPLLFRAISGLGLAEAAREIASEAGALGVALDSAPAPEHGAPHAAGAVMFGRFEVVREVAKTPHAEVLEAVDRVTGQRVAVKLLAAATAGTGRDAFVRFEREARALKQLRHATTVPLIAYFPDGPAMVLEWMAGGSLADLSRTASFAPARAVEITAAVLTALGEAHRLGMLHRDVKPSNILFDGVGAPRLGDFGAAHLGDLSTTVTAGAIGTFAYMSPEQRMGRPATVASDVYSAGAVLYEMLTGLPAEPTPAGHFLERAPSAYHDDLGPAHDEVVGRMLAEDVKDRPADAFAARRALEGLTWSTRVLARAEVAAPSTRSSRPPAGGARLGPATDVRDGRDAAFLRRDAVTARDVLVVPMDDAALALARGFARVSHAALPLVLRASVDDHELWVEPPRGVAWADAEPTADLRATLRAAIHALHAEGGAHGALDPEHLYVDEETLIVAWPRRVAPSIDAAKRLDDEALERLLSA